MHHQRDSFDADVGAGILGIGITLGIFLVLLVAFVIVVTVVFVVRTFVQYPGKRKTLWLALACCIASCIGAGFVYKLSAFGSIALGGIGIAVLLITCLAVELKNRDTFMRENVNLIDEVLHTPWWGSE